MSAAVPTLSAEGLGFGYPGRRIGTGVDLALEAGRVLCLLGPNGSGKTTLFKTLLGLLPAQAGGVRIEGRPLAAFGAGERARAMGYVPQAHNAFFPFTVREVVLMGRAARIGLFSAPAAADHAAAERALDRLGIRHLADRVYTAVSGGERQMALIARALAQEPRLLVMDEPTASLDFGNQARVLEEIGKLRGQGLAIVLSTHDPDHAFACADQVALLHDGRLVAQGPPATTVTSAHLRQIYGVDVVVAYLAELGRHVCSPSLANHEREFPS